MIVYIHSHEIADRGYTMGRHAAARDIAHIIVPDGTAISGIVSLVNTAVADAGSIWTLIFNGHGDELRSGSIYFGNWIDSSSVNQFSPLARLMNQRGLGVELHCCRGAASETMLLNMSRAFGVRVTAPLEDQLGMRCADIGGSSVCLPVGGDTQGVFEGPIIRAHSDGRIVHSGD